MAVERFFSRITFGIAFWLIVAFIEKVSRQICSSAIVALEDLIVLVRSSRKSRFDNLVLPLERVKISSWN